MSYMPGTILFACPDDDQALDDAKNYFTKNNLSYDTHKVVRRDKMLLIEAR